MDYTADFLNRIKQFGLIGWELDKILTILTLSPAEKEQFVFDFGDNESIVYAMYQNGLQTGQFNLAAAEYKTKMAEAEEQEIKNRRRKDYLELEKELFG